jgi:hypothetical protein
MSILQSAGALGALLGGAAGLVRELRRPQLNNEQFAALLSQEISAKQGGEPDAEAARIQRESARFVSLRDSDGDGALNLAESGLDRETFKRLDADGDGRLTADEVARPRLEALRRYGRETHGST